MQQIYLLIFLLLTEPWSDLLCQFLPSSLVSASPISRRSLSMSCLIFSETRRLSFVSVANYFRGFATRCNQCFQSETACQEFAITRRRTARFCRVSRLDLALSLTDGICRFGKLFLGLLDFEFKRQQDASLRTLVQDLVCWRG